MRPAEWISDGQVTAESGVNSALEPDLIEQGQVAWMENAQARGGKPTRRPVFIERARLPSGVFNGAALVRSGNGRILAGFNGSIYQLAADNDFIPKVVNTGNVMATHADLTFAETDRYVVVGSSGGTPPLIYSAEQYAEYARPDEVPPCQAVAYGSGRVWAAQGDRLYAGDIFQPNIDRSELRFDEIKYWAGGGYISFPSRINALVFMPASDSTTGFGVLLVFGSTWTHAVRADVEDRLAWASTVGFRTVVFPNIGCRSGRSVAIVNQDVFFRDQFGELRTIRQAVLDMDSAGSTAISREVSRVFNRDIGDFLDHASIAYWGNRLLCTSSPKESYFGTTFDSLAVLDFAPISSMRGKAPPSWFGSWSGYQFAQVISGRIDGVPRCFVVVADESRAHRLLEIVDQVEEYDVTGEVATPVSCAIETRAFDMTNRFTLKRLQRADLYLSGLTGDTNVKIKLRTDYSADWMLWDEWQINVDGTDAPDAGYVLADANNELVTENNDAIINGLVPDINYLAYSFADLEDPVVPERYPDYIRVVEYSPNPTIITADPLVIGRLYRVKSVGANTNFIPVGSSLARDVGVRFIATASTGAVWDGAELEAQDTFHPSVPFPAVGDVFPWDGIDGNWSAGSVLEASRGAMYAVGQLYEPLNYAPRMVAAQYRVRLKTRSLDEIPADGQILNIDHGFVFQLRIEITGASWALDRVQLFALPVEDAPFAFSDRVVSERTRSIRTTDDSVYSPEIFGVSEVLVDENGEPLEDEENQTLHDA